MCLFIQYTPSPPPIPFPNLQTQNIHLIDFINNVEGIVFNFEPILFPLQYNHIYLYKECRLNH